MTINPLTGKAKFPFTKTYPYSELGDVVNSLLDPSKKPLVIFSMWETAEDAAGNDFMALVPDILSPEPALLGRCIFTISYWRVSPSPVYSKEYLNPTWKDILNACNNLLQNGDGCGVYFENIEHLRKTDGVDYFEFWIGS